MRIIINVITFAPSNDRTSNNIKHINSMKALELKDLKAGNIYKKVTENDTLVLVQVLSEGCKAICNYFYVALNDKNEVIASEIKKRLLLINYTRWFYPLHS